MTNPYVLTDLTRGVRIGYVNDEDAAYYLANQLAEDNPGTTFTLHKLVAGEPKPLYTITNQPQEIPA